MAKMQSEIKSAKYCTVETQAYYCVFMIVLTCEQCLPEDRYV